MTIKQAAEQLSRDLDITRKGGFIGFGNNKLIVYWNRSVYLQYKDIPETFHGYSVELRKISDIRPAEADHAVDF